MTEISITQKLRILITKEPPQIHTHLSPHNMRILKTRPNPFPSPPTSDAQNPTRRLAPLHTSTPPHETRKSMCRYANPCSLYGDAQRPRRRADPHKLPAQVELRMWIRVRTPAAGLHACGLFVAGVRWDSGAKQTSCAAPSLSRGCV